MIEQDMRESESCSVISNSLRPHELYSPWNSPGQNTGVGSPSLLQGIFPTQGSNPDLLHCRWILDHLSHKGSQRLLERVTYPFSSRYSQPKNQTKVSFIVGGFFTNWAIRKAPLKWNPQLNPKAVPPLLPDGFDLLIWSNYLFYGADYSSWWLFLHLFIHPLS